MQNKYNKILEDYFKERFSRQNDKTVMVIEGKSSGGMSSSAIYLAERINKISFRKQKTKFGSENK